MELQHVNIKIFAEDSSAIEREIFTPIFHSWIQNQADGELLLDVADYLHVPQGPGIVLIGHEADYSMDETEGRLGLRYNRKVVSPGSNAQRFAQALKAAVQACLKLELDSRLAGKLRFQREEIELFINDRALAPNDARTRAEHSAEIQTFFERALGAAGLEYRYAEDPRERFGLTIKSPRPVPFEDLLQKL